MLKNQTTYRDANSTSVTKVQTNRRSDEQTNGLGDRDALPAKIALAVANICTWWTVKCMSHCYAHNFAYIGKV